MSSDRKAFLMTSPALLVLVCLFVLPMSYFFVVSFWELKFYQLVPDASLDNYRRVYEQYLHAGLFTLGIALLIATITTFLAFLIAYMIRFHAGRFGPLVLFVALVTLFGGYLVKIYVWKTILGINGILNQLLVGSGLVAEPIAWLLYSPCAVVLTLVHFLLPFAILPIIGSLGSIDDAPLESARDLGASSLRIFFTVILPIIRPTLIGAALIAMAVSLDDFIITFFTIGSGMTLPTLIWGMLRTSLDPSINALGTLVLVATVSASILALHITRYRG